MSIAIFFDQKDPAPWSKALKERLPNIPIEVYPSIKDPNTVTFAVCWKPLPGILSQYTNLKVIQSIGAGVDHIVSNQQLSEKITLTRLVDSKLTEDLYEYVLAGIMSYMRGFPIYQKNQSKIQWKPLKYRRMKSTTVTVLGLGAIGSYIATQLAQVGFQVNGWSRNIKSLENVAAFEESQLHEALIHTDVLVNVLPLTPQTENILNHEVFSRLNKGGYVINVGRGKHLEEEDLILAIQSGHLSGALLDVFREEPLPKNHVLWSVPSITITPHVAAITSLENAINTIVTNWHNLQSREGLINRVEQKRGY